MRVGIIAIDPTSPLSGGGLLGDRVRLRDVEGADGLFIRSVASRGHHGGLSRSARAFVKVLEVMGYDIVFLETVGIGQDQVTVSLVADTTVVVVAPGLGDHLQAIKSGVFDVGDVFVVNKADRSDADRAALDLESAVRLRQTEDWRPPVVKTVAADGRGVEALMTEIERHMRLCASRDVAPGVKARAAAEEITEAVKSRLLEHFCGREALQNDAMARFADEICERKIDPYAVADMILAEKGIL